VDVQVRLPTLLRTAAGGNAAVVVEGSTVGEVLANLQQRYPAIEGQLLSEDGGLHRFVNVYVNDEDVRYLEQLSTSVNGTDVVSILPAVAGGSC